MPAFAVSSPVYPDQYNVTWTSPSANSSGAMPLGNGDIGINAWVEADGDLLFFLSKSDAWSENVRLLKLGRVRVSLSPNPFVKGKPFEQVLHLQQGEIAIRAGNPGEEVTLNLWVDANQPVVRLEASGQQKFHMTVNLEIWRTEDRVLTGRDLTAAMGMDGAPHPVVDSGDSILPPQGNRISWYHRNATSIWPETLQLQGLEAFIARSRDPLLHRTFGGVIIGTNLLSESATRLKSSAPQARYAVSIYPYTAQTDTPEEWTRKLDVQIARTQRTSLAEARVAHRKWWQAFWERSHIQVTIANPADAMQPRVLPQMTITKLPLNFGADPQGNNRFTGDMDRIRIYNRALSADEVAVHAQRRELTPGPDATCIGDWTFDNAKNGQIPNRAGNRLPAQLLGDAELVDGPDGKAVRLHGAGSVRVAYDPLLDLRQACTLEAWICPRVLGGRIIDHSQSGTSTGYMLDMVGGLRMISRVGHCSANPRITPNTWAHVVATFDTHIGTRLYVDGKLIGERPAGSYEVKPEVISQGYALQRFMNACAGRGAFPIKFNGSIFTVDGPGYDADYRMWGGAYWFQNTRLPYWPMLATGDFEMMRPMFGMYQSALPLATERTRRYFNHAGAFFPETIYFWGTYTNKTYGWERNGKQPDQIAGGAIDKHYNGNLELLALMLDYYTFTGDRAFAKKSLVPMADELLLFWDQHYPRDAAGRLHMTGAKALETYGGLTNPLPDVAGLHWTLDGLLKLPKELLPDDLRARWARLQQALPPIPIKGEQGKRYIAVSENTQGGPGNYENPELYAIFPFRLYGVGKPDLDVARNAFARRIFMGHTGWEQDDIQAAMLGDTETAAQYVSERFATKNAGNRFPAIWGPNYDWLPDQDHGGVAMRALQAMLLQDDGNRLILFPAWPKGWDVDFKLHAPLQTIVEGRYHAGKLEQVKVTPNSRTKDLVILDPR